MFALLIQAFSIFLFSASNRICSVQLDIDLNQPLEHIEEPMSAPMVQTGQKRIIPEKFRTAKPKRRRDKLKLSKYRKTFMAKLKEKPQNYEDYKTKKREKAKEKYNNLSKGEREEELSKKRVRYHRLMKHRKEQDPNYRKTDSRSELRKRIREGKPSEEDVRKYAELVQKDRIRYKVHSQAASNSAKKQPHEAVAGHKVNIHATISHRG